jgi:prepilin-type N-terminal cleavage/methylation domain-containing protein
MHSFPSRNVAARKAGGFTLVELLVVIGIIAILAGVALGPITNGIRKAKESGAMQTTRTIALAEFQYANDNDQTYPDGVDAGVIGLALITGNYVSDPGLFYISGDAAAAKLAGVAAGFVAHNCSYDFTGVGANVGVGSTAPDQLPLVWSEGQTGLAYPAAGAGQPFTPVASSVFGKDGIAVCYHSNNAYFRAPNGNASLAFPPAGQAVFIDQTFDPGIPPIAYAIRAGASGI